MYLPSNPGKTIMNKLLKGKRVFAFYGHYFSTCNKAKYKSIYFMIDNYWFEVSPDTFVI
jgi:hypothetical protein